jgi:type VI secretion system protein ImpC
MAEQQLQTPAGVETKALEVNAFEEMLKKEFKPRTDHAKAEVENAVKVLASQVLAKTAMVSDDVVRTIQAIIAEIDRKLTEQINAIMHHEDFQRLESAWRGLSYLVSNTETDEMLKIRVLNISKKELG